MDIARFRKEALYSSKKMGRRLSAKEETLLNLDNQADIPSFLRRKVDQGKAQFGGPSENEQK